MTLLHCEESWHDWEHAATLSLEPDPLFIYPLFDASHALPAIVTVLRFAAGVVFGLLPDCNLTTVAPLSSTRFSHVVLKWLHHLEEE